MNWWGRSQESLSKEDLSNGRQVHCLRNSKVLSGTREQSAKAQILLRPKARSVGAHRERDTGYLEVQCPTDPCIVSVVNVTHPQGHQEHTCGQSWPLALRSGKGHIPWEPRGISGRCGGWGCQGATIRFEPLLGNVGGLKEVGSHDWMPPASGIIL